ncbi:hypothetical protein FKW77_000285 [Venturia effusa]|uniref:Uncharacterized protein n=1 Tax=Venturia effusa TaxID=50376 RepID=A0A517LA80_9PEZI|nr:hypothetical protein FKW77_000285 [Venturia effusa]
MTIATKIGENSVSPARTSTDSSILSTPTDEQFHDAISDLPREIPLSRPESPLSSLGHLGLIRSQRNALQSELRQQQESAAEAKKAISSLRRLALRLAVRISVKEANIASHSKALAKARMNQYLLMQQQQHLQNPSYALSGNAPISPPQSPVSNKTLPALPRADKNGAARFISPWHDTTSIQEVIDNGENRLMKMDASHASLKEELDVTRRKLERLFDSQAVLREMYNLEREKSKDLDEESQKAHARIASLEDAKRKIEEETVALHAKIKELSEANAGLTSDLEAAQLSRQKIEEDLGRIQSDKLTLEHQLQAAVRAKDVFEDQLNSLKASSAIVNEELHKKLEALQDDSIQSGETRSTLEVAKEELNDELRVANFRLCAAIELEIEVRAQFNQLQKQERAVRSDLDASRRRVEQLEDELQSAHQRMQDMDQSILSLSESLKESEKAKTELEEVTRMALSSREQVESHLREMEEDKAKVEVWLRTTREQLKATETAKTEVETEIQALRAELTQAHKRNEDLETMVEKAETKLNVVVEEQITTVNHPEETVMRNNQGRGTSPETSSDVTEELVARQKEIKTLQRTNDDLMEKLGTMTRELGQLKSAGRSPSASHNRSASRLSDRQSASGITDERSSSRLTDTRPGSLREVVAAEELYHREVKQLRETRATFDRVVDSLRTRNTELELLGKWHDSDIEDNFHTPERVPSPIHPMHNLAEASRVAEGVGRAAAAMQPLIVAGHDAASEKGVLEAPSARAAARRDVASRIGVMEMAPTHTLKKCASAGGLRSWKDERTSRWMDDIPVAPVNHRRSRSDVLSHHQGSMLFEREAILRVGFIASPSVSASPASVTRRPGAQYWKELPARPSVSSGPTSPRNVVNKELPPLPCRIVGRSKSLDNRGSVLPSLRRSRTTGDLQTMDHIWSLFPKMTPSQSRDAALSTTAPQSSRPKRWSSESAPASGHSEVSGTPPSAQETALEELRAKVRELMEAQMSPLPPSPPPKQDVEPPQRHLRLKRSFAKLTNLSKKPEGMEHEKKISHGGSRFRSLFRRPSKPLRAGESDKTQAEAAKSNAASRLSMTKETPKGNAVQPPKSPVGTYDPVAKMWLTPERSPTRTQFGVFVPESRVYMAPNPKSDSLQGTVTVDANTRVGSNLRRNSVTDMSDEKAESALPLEERVETIRIEPLEGETSRPTTLILPEMIPSLKAVESYESISTFEALQVHDRPRPWKPAQVLGLEAPLKDHGLDSTIVDEECLGNFDSRPSIAVHPNHSVDGSGYMSFESDHEPRAPWRSFMKHVPRLLKRTNKLRHG